MAPNRGRNRAAEFEEYMPTVTKDFDPEEEIVHEDSEADSDVSDNEADGREHYADVAKSKLRKPREIPLGPQYRGSKVKRAELEENEDEDDPFSKGFADEDSEEDEDMEENVEDDSEDDMEEHGTDETDLSDEDGEETLQHDDSRLKKDLAAVVQKEESIANSISRATALDAEKGRAIKKQRTAFDTLLNTRMKLQKSLISVNTLAGTSSSQLTTELPTAQQALEAAETAAFTLWHSLNALRVDLDAAAAHGSIPRKRNRTTFTLDTPTPSLWTHVLGQESARRPDRDATLHKWSRKTQPVAVHPAANRIAHTTAPTPTILDALAEQLTHRDRLMARTRQPRSCAPLQAARRVDVDPAIYDDADFYGLLLKELLERKAAAGAVAASDIDVGARMRSENKTRRWVDTKASKGRKLRYTVHEKLQNFMAPDDRTTWGERQVEELFGGLFGRRGGLGEKDGEEEEDQGEEEVVGVEEGFNLFAR